jgi:hypothetical protein
MPPLSSDLYTELLRAICKALDRHQKVSSQTLQESFKALAAMSKAASDDLIAATEGPPFEDLEAKVALKLLSLLEDDRILASCSVSVIWSAIFVLDLAAQLDPKALQKFEDAIVRQAPVMSSRQLAHTLRGFSAAGRLSSSKASAALITAVAHALPKMAQVDIVRVCTSFGMTAKGLKAEALAPFLEALPGVVAKLNPQGVGNIMYMIGTLFKSWNTSPDKDIINAFLTAVLRTAHEMDPIELSNCTLAFGMIPLPFDSPAGHALLAELPRGMKGVDARMFEKVMCGLVSAEVAFSEELTDALWTALIRVAPSFTRHRLVTVLGHTAFLRNKVVIPEEVRTVFLQAVVLRAPLLDCRTAQATVNWLSLLDWEVPYEVFARQWCSVQ